MCMNNYHKKFVEVEEPKHGPLENIRNSKIDAHKMSKIPMRRRNYIYISLSEDVWCLNLIIESQARGFLPNKSFVTVNTR